MSGFSVGDHVLVLNKNCTGVISYIGKLDDLQDTFYGIELSKPLGKNDGTFKNKQYFKCDPSYGAFVRRANLKKLSTGRHDGRPNSRTRSRESGYLAKYSAARSHEQNEKYMNDFEEGLESLRRMTHQDREITDTSTRVPQSKLKTQIQGDPLSFTSAEFHFASTSDYYLSNLHNSRCWANGPTDPQGTLFDASDLPLLCAAIDPSGTQVVVGGSDHGLRVVEARTGKQKRNLYTKKYGHAEWVTCVAYCPDGSIISGGMDKKLCLWSPNGIRCIDLESHTHSISKVKVTKTGSHAVSSSYDKTLKLWNLHGRGKGTVATTLMGHTAPVLDFAFSGGYIFSASRDGVAMAWDIERGSSSHKLGKHSGHVTSLECTLTSSSSADNLNCPMIVATGDQAGTLRVWDIRVGGKPVSTKQAHPGGAINEMKYSPLHSALVTAGADKIIMINDARMNMRTRAIFDSHKDFIYSLQLAENYILTGAGDGMLLVHDIIQERLLYGLGANAAGVRCIEVTEDLIVAAGDDGNVLTYAFD